jgi:hypothetical protein
MHRFGKETVFATYRVRPGSEAALLDVLARHEPILRRLGLTNGEPALRFRGRDATGGPVIVELFAWKDRASVEAAHRHPEVGEIWGAIEALVEERGGLPKWDFPHFEAL